MYNYDEVGKIRDTLSSEFFDMFGENSYLSGTINRIWIYKKNNNSISGKITWMKEPLDQNGNLKTDPLNPDEKLRKRKRMGMKIMYGFIYKGSNTWKDGRVYDPKKGKIYGGKITLTGENKLKLKGYLLGFPLIGRSSVWTRKLSR